MPGIILNLVTSLLVLTVLVGCNPKGKAVFDGGSITGGDSTSGTVPTVCNSGISNIQMDNGNPGHAWPVIGFRCVFRS